MERKLTESSPILASLEQANTWHWHAAPGWEVQAQGPSLWAIMEIEWAIMEIEKILAR